MSVQFIVAFFRQAFPLAIEIFAQSAAVPPYSTVVIGEQFFNASSLISVTLFGIETVVSRTDYDNDEIDDYTDPVYGIDEKLNAIPSLALGAQEINLIDMTEAYATFANEGYKIEPYFINNEVKL